MVKKKNSSKKVKRKSSRRTQTPSKKKVVKRINRTFSNFEERIDRLRQLSRELNALDTRGFSTEADIIKSKLKDPTAISFIESKLRELRKKVLRKSKKKKPMDKIQRKVASIAGDIPELEKEIMSIKSNLKKSEAEREEKEGEIKKIKLRMKVQEEEQKKKEKIRVDPTVDMLVQENYSDFVSGLKKELTRKKEEDEQEFKRGLEAEYSDKKRKIELERKSKMEEMRNL